MSTSTKPKESGHTQGIGKLESEMQQLRGILGSFATNMASLRSVAAAAPSQYGPSLLAK